MQMLIFNWTDKSNITIPPRPNDYFKRKQSTKPETNPLWYIVFVHFIRYVFKNPLPTVAILS